MVVGNQAAEEDDEENDQPKQQETQLQQLQQSRGRLRTSSTDDEEFGWYDNIERTRALSNFVELQSADSDVILPDFLQQDAPRLTLSRESSTVASAYFDPSPDGDITTNINPLGRSTPPPLLSTPPIAEVMLLSDDYIAQLVVPPPDLGSRGD